MEHPDRKRHHRYHRGYRNMILISGMILTVLSSPVGGGWNSGHHGNHRQQGPRGHVTTASSSAYNACVHVCDCASSKTVVNCSGHGLRTLGNLTFPPQTLTLRLDSNLLTHLTASDLSGLSKLRTLNISRNHLVNIHPKALSGLPSLQHVDLSYNTLTTLPTSLWEKHPNLTFIKLRLNNLTEDAIANLSLSNLPKLRSVDLSHNPLSGLKSLPAAFSNLTGLRTLYLAHAALKTISEDFFKPLAEIPVDYVDLSYNILSKVSETAFNWLPSMSYLDVSYTYLTTETSQNLFLGLQNTSLDVLRLRFVYVDSGGDHLLKGRTFEPLHNISVRILDLRGNHQGFRGEVHNNFFKHVPHLHELYLDLCMLTDIHEHAFAHLSHLTVLSLRYNFLNCVRGCGFLKQQGYTMPHLDVLDLTENVISELGGGGGDAGFSGNTFPKLTRLLLTNNKLRRIATGAFSHLKNLRHLDLSGNPLVTVDPRIFHSMHSLETLEMSRCGGLRTLGQKVFRGLTTLRRLELVSVGLETIHPGFLSGVPMLEVLILRDNHLSTLHVGVHQTNLTRLDIGENDFHDLPTDLLEASPALHTLLIDGNSIVDASPRRWGPNPLTNLSIVDLSDNSLLHLDPAMGERLPVLRRLFLAGNPFQCGCDTEGWVRWLRDSRITVPHSSDCLCRGDPHPGGDNSPHHSTHPARGLVVFDYESSTWVCHSRSVVIPLACFVGGSLITLLLVGMSYALFQRCWCTPRPSSEPGTPTDGIPSSPQSPNGCAFIFRELRTFRNARNENGGIGETETSTALLEETENHMETVA